MQKKTKKRFWCAGIMGILFAVFTCLVAAVDVQPIGPEGSLVGFASVNRCVFAWSGMHSVWYEITEILGIAALFPVLGFGLLGLYQLVTRKSIRKVDGSLLVLGGVYGLLVMVYLFFELVVINCRPVLMEGQLEASYPSSHVMLIVCAAVTSVMELRRRWPGKVGRWVDIAAAIVVVAAVFGRLFSGVHWLTDILGGVLVAAALVALYSAGVHYIEERGANKESGLGG